MRRRKPDSIELQQMKAQAKEEKARRLFERNRFLREKELREEAEKKKLELEHRLAKFQEESHGAQEALCNSEKNAQLMAEKMRLAEEKTLFLSQKAAEAQVEIQRIKVTAIKTEEEKHLMQRKFEEAELKAQQILENNQHRLKEAEQLKAQLYNAKLAEQKAKINLAHLLQKLNTSSSSIASSHSKSNSISQLSIENNNNDGEQFSSHKLEAVPTSVAAVATGLELSPENGTGVVHHQNVKSIDYVKPNIAGGSGQNNNGILWNGGEHTPMVSLSDLSGMPYNNNQSASTSLQGLVKDIDNININSYLDNDSRFNNSLIYGNLASPLAARSSTQSSQPTTPTVPNVCQTSFSGAGREPLNAFGSLQSTNNNNNNNDMHDVDIESHEFLDLMVDSDLDKLEHEVEKERLEYLQKSKHLQEQLKELKSEMEDLKVDEKMTTFDRIHDDNVTKGENKYSTLKKTKSGTTKARVAFFEEL